MDGLKADSSRYVLTVYCVKVVSFPVWLTNSNTLKVVFLPFAWHYVKFSIEIVQKFLLKVTQNTKSPSKHNLKLFWSAFQPENPLNHTSNECKT